jgi:hypothetical protein
MTTSHAVKRFQTDVKRYTAAKTTLKNDRANENRQLATAELPQQLRIRDTFDGIISKDQRGIAADRKRALKDLHPAELDSNLKQTNKFRAEVGLNPLHHALANTKTVQGCAQALLSSKNVSFWSGLSTGSDRKNVERLARGEKAFVPATGGHVTPSLKMMQALVAMSKQGHIQINALKGGQHVTNSNHYRGHAVDLDLSTGNAGMIERVARRYGGVRNFETSHIHLDF